MPAGLPTEEVDRAADYLRTSSRHPAEQVGHVPAGSSTANFPPHQSTWDLNSGAIESHFRGFENGSEYMEGQASIIDSQGRSSASSHDSGTSLLGSRSPRMNGDFTKVGDRN